MKPYIICHMVTSLDGKVTGDFLADESIYQGIEYYYELNRKFNADAFLCGRVTMEGSFTFSYYPDLKKYQGISIERCDFIANNNAKLYAVACDRYGRLGWKDSLIIDPDPGYGGSHIIEVLTEEVKDEYLAYLREKGVSYVFGGKYDLDVKLVLEKLYKEFGIKKLLLEGGSIINGAFMKADVIDEISLVVVPITAKTNDKPLFLESDLRNFRLEKCEKVQDNIVYLNYKKLED